MELSTTRPPVGEVAELSSSAPPGDTSSATPRGTAARLTLQRLHGQLVANCSTSRATRLEEAHGGVRRMARLHWQQDSLTLTDAAADSESPSPKG